MELQHVTGTNTTSCCCCRRAVWRCMGIIIGRCVLPTTDWESYPAAGKISISPPAHPCAPLLYISFKITANRFWARAPKGTRVRSTSRQRGDMSPVPTTAYPFLPVSRRLQRDQDRSLFDFRRIFLCWLRWYTLQLQIFFVFLIVYGL